MRRVARGLRFDALFHPVHHIGEHLCSSIGRDCQSGARADVAAAAADARRMVVAVPGRQSVIVRFPVRGAPGAQTPLRGSVSSPGRIERWHSGVVNGYSVERLERRRGKPSGDRKK
jgi:hypothetical protein